MTLEGLNEDFPKLLVLLADARVEFVIIGAYAPAADFTQPGAVYQIGLRHDASTS